MGFIDENVGWVYQRGVLAATADSGQNWQNLALPEGAAKVKAVCPVSVSAGYILDENGIIFRTKDQGQSWEALGCRWKDSGDESRHRGSNNRGLRFLTRKMV